MSWFLHADYAIATAAIVVALFSLHRAHRTAQRVERMEYVHNRARLDEMLDEQMARARSLNASIRTQLGAIDAQQGDVKTTLEPQHAALVELRKTAEQLTADAISRGEARRAQELTPHGLERLRHDVSVQEEILQRIAADEQAVETITGEIDTVLAKEAEVLWAPEHAPIG